MGKKYFVSCPARSITGGPQLAHQLCRMLIDFGIDAKMHYYEGEQDIYDWEDVSDTVFGQYNLPYVLSMEELDSEDSIIIFPETHWILAHKLKHATMHMWWMSVYYYEWTTSWYGDEINSWFKDDFLQRENSFHFVQSKYAYDYCIETMKIPANRVYYLTDYIDELYFEDKQKYRQNYVFYNPAKLSDLQKSLLEEYSDEFNWFPIKGMTKDEINNKLHEGKVYVDFGHHPGKDRIPREAAACGCCVITNTEGSAANDVDVPIPDKYKINNPDENRDKVIDTIRYCIFNYNTCIPDFESYRNWIHDEKARFTEEVKQFISLTNNE